MENLRRGLESSIKSGLGDIFEDAAILRKGSIVNKTEYHQVPSTTKDKSETIGGNAMVTMVQNCPTTPGINGMFLMPRNVHGQQNQERTTDTSTLQNKLHNSLPANTSAYVHPSNALAMPMVQPLQEVRDLLVQQNVIHQPIHQPILVPVQSLTIEGRCKSCNTKPVQLRGDAYMVLDLSSFVNSYFPNLTDADKSHLINTFMKLKENGMDAGCVGCTFLKLLSLVQPSPGQAPKNKIAVGIFWDIENCTIPRNVSGADLVKKIRSRFLNVNYHIEKEFVVACDLERSNFSTHVRQLEIMGINLVHVNTGIKNAADHKLRIAMHQFAKTYPSPATVILISGDSDFAHDVTQLRYEKNFKVIVIHSKAYSKHLVKLANHSCPFELLLRELENTPMNMMMDLAR